VAHLRKGETYTDLACGFAIGTSTVYHYLREALDLLAAMAPTLTQAIEVARGKAFVILDGTLLRIDRVGMIAGRDRPYHSGKHKCHGLNVQVLAEPTGRPDLAITHAARFPTRPGRRPRARNHRRAQRHRRARGGRHRLPGRRPRGAGSPATAPPRSGHRLLPAAVAPPRGRQHGPRSSTRPGERANAELKNWKILRKIRSSPSRSSTLGQAIQTLIIAT